MRVLRRIQHWMEAETSVRKPIVVAILVSFLTLVTINPLLANSIISTDPIIDSVLTVAPNSVTINGSGALLDLGSQITVIDPSGARIDDGSITVDGNNLIVGLKPLTNSGVYVVTYELLALNDVPLDGTFKFTVNGLSQIKTNSISPTPEPITNNSNPNKITDYLVIGLLVFAFFMLILISRFAKKTFKK
ncbi:MAG: hypothetical protein F2734_02125 [Actinobacteria bacterium]|nr:hypothetical protein [Actinomycetota bacterium]MSX85037.1 hypothetical protein [Actinomycetota bacterium]MSY23688.1 hypothetical protein [Actinomycetota bacterium]MSZ62023.1 hypothetical protein [Actinomycetota bacterium]MTA46350.1 hypothetical protein [Actinomycetota bacterium]